VTVGSVPTPQAVFHKPAVQPQILLIVVVVSMEEVSTVVLLMTPICLQAMVVLAELKTGLVSKLVFLKDKDTKMSLKPNVLMPTLGSSMISRVLINAKTLTTPSHGVVLATKTPSLSHKLKTPSLSQDKIQSQSQSQFSNHNPAQDFVLPQLARSIQTQLSFVPSQGVLFVSHETADVPPTNLELPNALETILLIALTQAIQSLSHSQSQSHIQSQFQSQSKIMETFVLDDA